MKTFAYTPARLKAIDTMLAADNAGAFANFLSDHSEALHCAGHLTAIAILRKAERCAALLAELGADESLGSGLPNNLPMIFSFTDKYISIYYPDKTIDDKHFELLGRSGFNLNATANERLETALMTAASYGMAKVCDKFVDLGIELDRADSRGKTALHYAAANGQQEAALALLGKGADWRIKDCRSRTAYDLALATGNAKTARLLLAYQEERILAETAPRGQERQRHGL